MNKCIAKKYESVKLPIDLFPYIDEILSQNRKSKVENKVIKISEVLVAIARQSPPPIRNDSAQDVKIGIPQNKLEEDLKIDRHILKEILGILSGATLIQYDDQFRVGKYWTCTPRAWQYLSYCNNKKEK